MSELSGFVILLLVVLGVLVVWLWRYAVRVCEHANGADWGGRWINRLDGLNRIFCRRVHRLAAAPMDLPNTGGALVASNHVSGLDPLLLIAASPRPLRFLIAAEQYHRWWLRWLFRAVGCIPIDRSRNPRRSLDAAREALLRGEVVALFPHGRIHLDHHDPVPLKRGIARLASQTSVPIYPVRIEGVRAEGRTVSAVFFPSRISLKNFPPLLCNDAFDERFLEALWDRLAHDSVEPEHNPHRPRATENQQKP